MGKEEDDRNTNIIISPLSATLSDVKSHHDFRVDCLGDKTDNKSWNRESLGDVIRHFIPN